MSQQCIAIHLDDGGCFLVKPQSGDIMNKMKTISLHEYGTASRRSRRFTR